MAAPVEIQLRNAESSILFMQQEHAKTLQGLHQELHKLQKKCAELTFELAMKSDDGDEEQYKAEINELKDKLEVKENECHQLKVEKEMYNSRLTDLEQQMTAHEKAHQEESKQQSQKLMLLTAELDQRSGTIAYLTTQLHQLKLKHVKPKIDTGHGNDVERVSSPAPPKDPAPPRVRRYNLRTGNGPVRAVHPSGRTYSDGVVPEPSQVQSHMFSRIRRVGSPRPGNHQRAEPALDVSAFIAHVDPNGKDVEVKPAPPVLPPIHPQDDRYTTLRDLQVGRKERSSTEIETLAIEKPYSADHAFRSPDHSPLHTD